MIDVSKNEITEIEKEAFKDIYLAEVDLSKNKISKIAAGAFINCNNLTRLDFTHNQIEQFNKFSFDENTYALSFQLSHNLLKDMSKVSYLTAPFLFVFLQAFYFKFKVAFTQCQFLFYSIFPKK